MTDKKGGVLTEEQADRFADLAAQSPPFELVESRRDPNFVPDPKACPACKERGKNWYGGDPTCAFLNNEEFDPDNRNCATMNELRALRDSEPKRALTLQAGDQKCLVSPLGDSEFLILSWYKNRGRTDGAWTLSSDLIEPLSLEAADRILQDKED